MTRLGPATTNDDVDNVSFSSEMTRVELLTARAFIQLKRFRDDWDVRIIDLGVPHSLSLCVVN